ncbi:MAG: shikimate kinase [Gemmatimonadetes bacterium]|nr:shikimate kinase [Gemmatimonadota bacterium]
MTEAPLRRVVIVGFMGAGKSTVGSLIAKALGWDFIDLDTEVARERGLPVDEIIRRRGIEDFRALESDAGRRVLGRDRLVLAVGGGWAVGPGHMDALDRHTLSVWLRVTPETAVRRVSGSDTPRPLLDVPDPLAEAATLLAERSVHYERSSITIDTEGRTPEEVALKILETPALQGLDKEVSA